MARKRRKTYDVDDTKHRKIVKELDDLISSLKDVVDLIENQVTTPPPPHPHGPTQNPHM